MRYQISQRTRHSEWSIYFTVVDESHMLSTTFRGYLMSRKLTEKHIVRLIERLCILKVLAFQLIQDYPGHVSMLWASLTQALRSDDDLGTMLPAATTTMDPGKYCQIQVSEGMFDAETGVRNRKVYHEVSQHRERLRDEGGIGDTTCRGAPRIFHIVSTNRGTPIFCVHILCERDTCTGGSLAAQ